MAKLVGGMTATISATHGTCFKGNQNLVFEGECSGIHWGEQSSLNILVKWNSDHTKIWMLFYKISLGCPSLVLALSP